MDAWVWISIAAAATQTVRFALQKVLVTGALSPLAATWSRFLFSAPLVLVAVISYGAVQGFEWPDLSQRFWIFAVFGGLSQVLATLATVALFQRRAFAIGITFKKTEVMLTALVGFVVLGDALSLLGAAAIAVGFLGVLCLSNPPDRGRILNTGTALGVLSGIFFAFSAVGYRGAVLALDGGDTVYLAGVTLALVTAGQTLGVGLYLMLRDPQMVRATVVSWRTSALVGVFSMIGSWCWFAAFSLQSAAYVFAVGQIEMVFSLIAGALFFRERLTRREGWGMALVLGSILALVLPG